MNMKGIVLVALALGASGVSRSDEPVWQSMVVSWADIQAREASNSGRSRSIRRAAPTATLEELESHITTLAPGEDSHPPHRHPQEEIVILKEGTLEARLEGQVITRVEAGGFVFLASNEEHSVRNVGTTPATYYVIQWKTKAAR